MQAGVAWKLHALFDYSLVRFLECPCRYCSFQVFLVPLVVRRILSDYSSFVGFSNCHYNIFGSPKLPPSSREYYDTLVFLKTSSRPVASTHCYSKHFLLLTGRGLRTFLGPTSTPGKSTPRLPSCFSILAYDFSSTFYCPGRRVLGL